MDGIHPSEDNPIKQTSEDILHREMNNNYHVLFQIEQSLQDIRNAVEANTANIDILEEVVATLTPIPARKINLTYGHKDNKLRVGDQLRWEYKKPFDTMAFCHEMNSWLRRLDNSVPSSRSGK